MRCKRLATLLLAAGCASTLPPQEQKLLEDCENLSLALERRRQTAAAHGQQEGAGALRKAICQLTERICQIAERNPGSDEGRKRCRHARQRCRVSALVRPAGRPGRR